ncbi:polyisoprenyl-teichoic acid--peptidoglycan teichoic acid transferase [Frankia sp. AiPs1]|uniref:LCP family glycopolymer transferase n=1 Tax=Frankia sp. AiPa1 TaxID=573492 RepID=UPI00202B9A37|nr:LCP family protein [Frankia sp. AiPa1]MCL9761761.1 LCP family protein [Frankia sp. AiPa1]
MELPTRSTVPQAPGALPADALPAGGLSVVAMTKAGQAAAAQSGSVHPGSGPVACVRTSAGTSGVATAEAGRTAVSPVGAPPDVADPDVPDPDVPPPPRRRGLRARFLLGLAGLLSFAVLVTSVGGWVVLTAYDHRIDRADIALPHADVTRPPAVPVGTENWLLVGSDVRTGSDAAKVGGARSDTMMIAHLDSDGTTSIVSIPRDLYVPIPSYTDAEGKRHRARHDRVNSAFNSGGPALLVATLEQLTGIRIDHYAEIDFGGFQKMTTAIGGVDVCLVASTYVEPLTLDNGRRVHATNLNDPSSGFVGHPGTNHIEGAQALAFVRQRHGFQDGDLSRIHRQQAFLAAVFRTVSSSGVLLNPGKLASFLGALTDSTLLDDGTNFSDLRLLAERMRGMTTGSVTFATVPTTGQVASPAFYFYYDPTAVRAFFAEKMGSGDQATATPNPTLEPDPTATSSPDASGTTGPTSASSLSVNGSRSASDPSGAATASDTAPVVAPVVAAGTALPGAAQSSQFTSVTPAAAGSVGRPTGVTGSEPATSAAVPAATAAASCIN